MFFYGYDKDDNKVYYNTKNNSVTLTPILDADETPFSAELTPKSLDDELVNYGFTPAEILKVKSKIDGMDSTNNVVHPVTMTNPSTNQTNTSLTGSLVSNSSMSFKNNTIYQKTRIELEKAKVLAVSLSNEMKKKQLDLLDKSLTLNGKIYEEMINNTRALKAQTLAIKNQDLKATVSTGDILVNPQVNIDTTALTEANIKIASGVDNQILTNASLLQKETEKINAINAQTLAIKNQELNLNGDMTANLSLDITPLSEANIKIAEGVENQILTNAKIVENILKKNEHYDFLKDGVSTLKDTNGNIIKPREAEALVNAEKHIDIKDINSTTMDDIMDFNQDLQQFLTGYSPESLFSDAVGSIDGFSENLNPFTYFDNVLKTEFELDLQKEKLKNGI